MNDIEFADRAMITAQNRAIRRALRPKIWRISVASAMVLSVSIAIYPLLPRSYNSSAMVLLQPTDQAGQPIIGRSTVNALDENEIAAYDDILSSRPMLLTVVNRLHLMDDPEFNPALAPPSAFDQWKQRAKSWLLIPPMPADEAVASNLRRHLFTYRAHKSYAMQIGFRSGDPVKAAAMANALADTFVASRLINKLHAQEHFTKELEQRQASLAQVAAETEIKRYDYLTRSGLVHRGEREALERQLITFSDQYAHAMILATAAEGRAKNLQEMQRLGTLDSAPEVLASPVIRNLKERLITLASGTSTGGGSATPEKLNELKVLMNGEAQRMATASQIEAKLTRAHADALRSQITQIDAKIVAWKDAERQLEVLERVADADRTVLKETMAQFRAQGSIIAALRSDAEVIAPAVVSSRPVFPNLPLYTIGTVFVAVLVSGALMLPTLIRATSRQQNYGQSYVHT